MAARNIRDFLDGKRERLLWLEYDAYARRVFANDAADWLTQSTRFANTMRQALKAVRTEVVTVDIALAGTASWPEPRPAEPLASAQAALTGAVPRRYTAECVDALQHALGAEVDLLLRFPSPRDLLAQAGSTEEPDFDALDDLSATVVSTLREFSSKSITGIVMTRAAIAPLSADESDAYAPIFSAARHYGWVTAAAFHETLFATDAPSLDGVDILLAAELPLARVRALRGATRGIGGGLTRNWWLDATASITSAAGDLLFGFIPEDVSPETVLRKCAGLAS